jgi:hypothetical protein
MGFTVHLMLTQYYMLCSGQWASLQTLIFKVMFRNSTFSTFAKTELLKHDVLQVNLWMEVYSVMSCAILLR